LKFWPRITSGFPLSRLHPVFRTHHAHLGIDYAAPIGASG
jgi:murein DD-endopeptidase MepM/ murein hydrolase activator NlpD